jgi:hypothetical protein
VRDTGVSFVMAGIGDELDVNTGIGTILNRFYVLEPGDASVRDYAFLRPHVPDPAKAEVTYQWDYSVLVTGLEIIMTTHGIVEVEGFVGGLASPEAGQYDDAESNYGWTSIGISAGSAGSGPYADGTTSIFAWPDNEISGVFFRLFPLRCARALSHTDNIFPKFSWILIIFTLMIPRARSLGLSRRASTQSLALLVQFLP